MDLTLDEYLAEVDRWKQVVTDEMLFLSIPARAEKNQQARAWLEARLGRRLPEVAPSQPEGTLST